MKFLKKPVFIKKIRSYSDNYKLSSFGIENDYKFISNKGVLKSSYLEKVIDLSLNKSTLNLKGGFFYFTNNDSSVNKKSFIIINNKKVYDSLGFKNSDVAKANLLSNYFRIVSLKKTNLFLKFKI